MGTAISSARGARGKKESEAAREPSSPDKVAAAITDDLMQRRFVPGQRLVETDLTERFDVSRGTIRTALKKLATEGLVRLVAHRGAYVRSLSTVDMTDLMLVLQYLEPLVYRLVAERIDEGSNRRKFKSAIDAVLSFEGRSDDSGLLVAQHRLRETLVDIAGNSELKRIMPLTHMYMFSAQVHQARSKRDIEDQIADFKELGAAVLAGDAAAAERLVRRGMRDGLKVVAKLPDPYAPVTPRGTRRGSSGS
jgi:DNA-binding GntR family transcriptional regulator